MNLTFKKTKETDKGASFDAFADGVEIGYFIIILAPASTADNKLYEIGETYIAAEEDGTNVISYGDFMDAVYKFLKTTKYRKFWAMSWDDDDPSLRQYGFNLVDRDNSGWDIKYFYELEL